MNDDRYYECGICDAMHRWEWDGDCRENNERFFDVPDDAEVFSWADRLEADHGEKEEAEA